MSLGGPEVNRQGVVSTQPLAGRVTKKGLAGRGLKYISHFLICLLVSTHFVLRLHCRLFARCAGCDHGLSPHRTTFGITGLYLRSDLVVEYMNSTMNSMWDHLLYSSKLVLFRRPIIYNCISHFLTSSTRLEYCVSRLHGGKQKMHYDALERAAVTCCRFMACLWSF